MDLYQLTWEITTRGASDRSGDNSGEETPVPIPNTEVKLSSADDTWREAAWESRSLPVHFLYGFDIQTRFWPHGQVVKTSPFHGGDMGSIPVGVTNNLICHFSSAGRATDLWDR